MKRKRELSREQAATWLTQHGRPTKPATLAWIASNRGGPVYVLRARRAWYSESDLAAWLVTSTSPPMRGPRFPAQQKRPPTSTEAPG
jgi:hypothetical protein